MKHLLSLAAVVVALSSCAHKSESLEYAEATRRAEVHETQERAKDLKEAQQDEQKRYEELAKEEAGAEVEAARIEASVVDAASDSAARAAEVTLAPDRAAFQRSARERLAALEEGLLALSDRTAVSTMPADIRDETGKGAADLRAQVIALQGRLPAAVEVNDTSWTMTRESLDEQIKSLEDRLEKLDATL